MTRSGLPSSLKSAAAIPKDSINESGEFAASTKLTDASGDPTGRYTTFDRPPPGAGFTTVIEAVAALARFAAGNAAARCSLLTKVVARASPFQSTVAPETKPVPLMLRAAPGVPGETAVGTSV